jgi:hypothetical protein
VGRYLVVGDMVEGGPLFPAEGLTKLIEQAVRPSLQMLVKWEEQGNVKGGIVAGVRKGVFIMEAASAEEIGGMLRSLPFWGLMKWEVTPLQSVQSAIDQDRKIIEQMKAMI